MYIKSNVLGEKKEGINVKARQMRDRQMCTKKNIYECFIDSHEENSLFPWPASQ